MKQWAISGVVQYQVDIIKSKFNGLRPPHYSIMLLISRSRKFLDVSEPLIKMSLGLEIKYNGYQATWIWSFISTISRYSTMDMKHMPCLCSVWVDCWYLKWSPETHRHYLAPYTSLNASQVLQYHPWWLPALHRQEVLSRWLSTILSGRPIAMEKVWLGLTFCFLETSGHPPLPPKDTSSS